MFQIMKCMLAKWKIFFVQADSAINNVIGIINVSFKSYKRKTVDKKRNFTTQIRPMVVWTLNTDTFKSEYDCCGRNVYTKYQFSRSIIGRETVTVVIVKKWENPGQMMVIIESTTFTCSKEPSSFLCWIKLFF